MRSSRGVQPEDATGTAAPLLNPAYKRRLQLQLRKPP